MTDDDVLSCIRRIEGVKLIDTAHRALSQCDAMFRYAKARKYIKHNPIADIERGDTLPAIDVKHHAAIVEPAKVGALMRAFNAAEYLPERRKMMQAWGDYLDGLRVGSQVVPIRQRA